MIQKLLQFYRIIYYLIRTTIDTDSNRKAMPDADFSKWTKKEDIANTIKNMADSQIYPTEGFLKL